MAPTWKAIAAMAENRVIGAAGGIPWRVPGEQKWVRACTLGQTIVMGRRTWDSLGRALPGRRNVVVSRALGPADVPEGVVILRSLAEVEQLPPAGDIWVFGGEAIYREALPQVAELYLTIVHQQPAGDTFFPEFEAAFPNREQLRAGEGFTIYRYTRA